jgi:hypothetical protein
MKKLRNELKGLSPNSKKLKQYKESGHPARAGRFVARCARAESLDKLSQVQ